MRRASVPRLSRLALIFLGLAATGVLSAAVLASPGQVPTPTTTVATGTTGTTTTETTAATTTAGTTTTATTTAVTTTTTATTTTAPKPKPTPVPKEPVRLPAGVTISGIHVGGLEPAAALEVVRTAFASPLTLTLGTRTMTVDPSTLGAVAYAQTAVNRARSAHPGTAVDLNVVVQTPAVRDLVARLADRFDQAAVDATLTLRQLKPFITPGRSGQIVDQQAAVNRVVAALRTNERDEIALPVRDIAQKVPPQSFGSVIVVRRGSNRLTLYYGTRKVREFGVATGQAIYPTPLGRFEVVVKWANPWWYPPASPWAKGLKPVPPGPGNPLGTRWMGLSAPGVGIHGTPDASSIGYSASHGCIRMFIWQAEWLFEHVDVGTPVFIVPA